MFEVVYLNLLHGLLQLLDPVIRTIGVLVIDPIEHQINVFPFFAPLAGRPFSLYPLRLEVPFAA